MQVFWGELQEKILQERRSGPNKSQVKWSLKVTHKLMGREYYDHYWMANLANVQGAWTSENYAHHATPATMAQATRAPVVMLWHLIHTYTSTVSKCFAMCRNYTTIYSTLARLALFVFNSLQHPLNSRFPPILHWKARVENPWSNTINKKSGLCSHENRLLITVFLYTIFCLWGSRNEILLVLPWIKYVRFTAAFWIMGP